MNEAKPTAIYKYIDPPPPYPGSELLSTHPELAVNGKESCPPYPGLSINGEGTFSPYPADPVVSSTIASSIETGPRFACPHCRGQFVYRKSRGVHPCPFCNRKVAISSYLRNRAIIALAMGFIFLLCGSAMIFVIIVAKTEWYFYISMTGIVVAGFYRTIRGAILLVKFQIAHPVRTY